MISAEWTRAVFATAKARGLTTALISDGHSTLEAVTYMKGVTDVLRIDLKANDEASYRRLGGRLQPVLDTIALASSLGYWVEVVTLVVPGLNQDVRAISKIGDMLREIDRSIPWHLNAFVPRYRMSASAAADSMFLMVAAGAAYVAGSRFVYVGNDTACAQLAHTRCPDCHTWSSTATTTRGWQTHFDGDAAPSARWGSRVDGRPPSRQSRAHWAPAFSACSPTPTVTAAERLDITAPK
jgi:pyruvate formate lyase activating enzyme